MQHMTPNPPARRVAGPFPAWGSDGLRYSKHPDAKDAQCQRDLDPLIQLMDAVIQSAYSATVAPAYLYGGSNESDIKPITHSSGCINKEQWLAEVSACSEGLEIL